MPGARRFTIRGRVQGVFFRANTRRLAESLGLTGHAINLDNGNVEVLACGDETALGELERWLQDGPPMAEVTDVIAEDVTWRALDGFITG